MEKLNQYLDGRKAVDLAREVGISPTHMSDIRSGRRAPSFHVARKIRDATNGYVQLDDWAGDMVS